MDQASLPNVDARANDHAPDVVVVGGGGHVGLPLSLMLARAGLRVRASAAIAIMRLS